MFKEILTNGQIGLLNLIQKFTDDFYMVGGTAIALQIGHRRSIDFDLFSYKSLDTMEIIRTIRKGNHTIEATLEETSTELTMVIDGVKITFLEYPFKIEPVVNFDDIITMPDLLTLSAMKAYSLGRRSKWKDYIDLYFFLRDHFSIRDISRKAKEIFGGEFNERLFREQLCYFEDIDFSEDVEYIREAIGIETIKKFLVLVSTEI